MKIDTTQIHSLEMKEPKELENRNNVNMLLNYRRIRNIKRCNNFPVLNTEDVAQHSYFVALLSMVITDEYNSWISQYWISDETSIPNPKRKFISTEKVLRKALMHDTDEAFSSDIPFNIKHFNKETHEVIEKALDSMMETAYAGTSELFQEYRGMARTCKEGIEGDIVNIADMTELAIQCYEEYTLGNLWVKSLLSKAVGLVFDRINETELKNTDTCPTLMKLLNVLCLKTDSNSIDSIINIG